MGSLSFQSAMTLLFLVFLWGSIDAASLLDLEKTRLNAKEISRELHDAFEENVGKKHLEKAYKTMSCSTVSKAKPDELLEEIVASTEHRFNQTLRVLMKSKASVIEQAAARNNTRGERNGAISLQHCCNALPGSLAAYNPRFRGEVNSSVACEKLHATNPKNTTNGDNLLETFSKNVELAETVSWQYFGSSQGYYLQYPSSTRVCNTSNTYDPRFTSWYVNAASRARTNMVLIIDISLSMAKRGRMELARQAALTVLDTLGADDSVGVLAFSSGVRTPLGCFGSVVAQANPTNINQLKEWVKQLSPVGGTKYAPAFIRAFEMLASKRTTQTPNVASVILFLTDGQPWETDNAIFDAIRQGQTSVQNRTIINTYGLGDGIDDTDLERLRKIAEQNGGTSVQIRDADAFKLRTIMGQYYAKLPGTTRDDPVISLPRIVNNLGLVTTMSAACLTLGSNDVMGVVAQDVIVAELVKEVVEFSSSSGLSYAALIDRKGRTIIHPNVPKPNEHIIQPVFQSLSLYEPGMKNGTLQRMTSGLPGSTAMMAYMSSSRGDPDTDGATTVVLNATYTWRLIRGSPYIVILVTAEGAVQTNEKYKFIAQHPSVKSYYHRLDLTVNKTGLAPPSVCSMDGHLVSKQFSTVKFAPEAFNDSSLFVSTPETVQEVISLANFFNDLSTQNTHQGLSESARVEVMLTAQPERHWNESEHRDPEAAQWRFVATEGGVFRVFPGIRLQKTYSHKKQPWYRRAIVNAGRLTISRPSTNNSALQSPGSLLSLVTTFDAMRCRTSEPLSSQIAGVVGFQLSLVSLHKILTRAPKLCDTFQQDCFIIDNSGYILSDVLNPQTNAFRHVTQVFPWLAASWASNGNIVKTSWCNNLEKHKVQLFHSLVLPRDGTSSVNGTELCRQYVVANLPDTNAYLLVLRSRTMYGCDENADIRECNQCEARCAKCTGHISPCQCPCSCSMSYDKCTNSITGLWTGIPCPVSVPKSLDTTVGVKANNIALLNVPLCPMPCDSLLDKDECNASKICHWCRFSAVPFCGSMCRTQSRMTVLILFPCNNFIELSLTQKGELKKSFRNTLLRIVPQLKPLAFDVPTMNKTGILITLYGTTDGIPVSHLRDQIMLAVERNQIVIGPTANVTQTYTAMSVKSYTNLGVQLFMSPWPDSGFSDFSEEQTLFEVTKVLQKALDSLLGTSLASQARDVSLTKSAISFYLTNEGKTSSYSITRIENRLKTAVNNSELFIQVPPHEKPWFVRNISTAPSFGYFCQPHPTDSTVTPSTGQISTDGDSHHTALPPENHRT